MRMKILTSIVITVLLFGCASGAKKTGTFADYQNDRPDVEYISVSSVELNAITKGIAGLYGTTLTLTDKTITQIENNKVAASLETVRINQGQEAYNKEVKNLKGEDKEIYDKYIDNEVNKTSIIVGYLANAAKLGVSIRSLVANPNALASSAFELPKVISAGSLATDQLAFSVKALNWMKKNNDALESAKKLRRK